MNSKIKLEIMLSNLNNKLINLNYNEKMFLQI